MYIPNSRYEGFLYKKISYASGTRVLFNGSCFLDDAEIVLTNQIATYMYTEKTKVYFRCNDLTYYCDMLDFEQRIVRIIVEECGHRLGQETYIHWTDAMVTKTLWYIVVMLLAIIFNDRIGIWVFATMVWYISTFKSQK